MFAVPVVIYSVWFLIIDNLCLFSVFLCQKPLLYFRHSFDAGVMMMNVIFRVHSLIVWTNNQTITIQCLTWYNGGSRGCNRNREEVYVIYISGSPRLIELGQENALVIANTFFQQHMRRLHMNIRRWSTPKYDWLYSLQPKMEKLYTVSKNKTRIWLWLRSWTPIAKFRLR